MDWFYAQNNQQQGPVTLEAIAHMMRQGALQPHDLVWHEGLPNWQPAGTVPELIAAISSPDVAPPSGVAPPPGPPPSAAPDEPQPAAPQWPHGATVGYFNPALGSAAPPMYAGFWLRFVAWIIDQLILGVAGAVLGFFVGLQNPMFMGHRGVNPFLGPALFSIQAFMGRGLAWLYYALMETSAHQATLGKLAVGLYVTDLYGQRLTFGRATGRYFGKIISDFTLFIGYIMAGFTQHRQALHDIMAGTLVLRRQ
jgi:uncharacterized RDD family membrane protein YckC